MQILPYEPSWDSQVVSRYSEAVRYVPHCYPVTVEAFEPLLHPMVEGGQSHKRLEVETALVAREGSELVGFIHLGISRPEEDEAPRGIIRLSMTSE